MEKINEIKERITSHSGNRGIYFGRIPEKEWTWFMQYAAEEWCNDYGLAFKSIIAGIMPPENTVLLERIEELESQVDNISMKLMVLESKSLNDSNPKVIKTLGGKVINKEQVN